MARTRGRSTTFPAQPQQ